MSAARKLNLSEDQFLKRTELVEGPLAWPPFGSVLEINPIGASKLCAFDCVYCNLGPTRIRLNQLKNPDIFPSVDSIVTAVQTVLQRLHREGPSIDALLVGGNGEPTLHPDLPTLLRNLLDLRGSLAPSKPVGVMTSGFGLDSRKTIDALNLVDDRIIKIDAGNEKLFKLVNAPLSRTNLAKVLVGIRKLRDITVQSMFFGGNLTNTSQTDIDDWIEVIAILKPKGVILYGLKDPIEGLMRCEEDTLYTIASRLERRTQIKAIVSP